MCTPSSRVAIRPRERRFWCDTYRSLSWRAGGFRRWSSSIASLRVRAHRRTGETTRPGTCLCRLGPGASHRHAYAPAHPSWVPDRSLSRSALSRVRGDCVSACASPGSHPDDVTDLVLGHRPPGHAPPGPPERRPRPTRCPRACRTPVLACGLEQASPRCPGRRAPSQVPNGPIGGSDIPAIGTNVLELDAHAGYRHRGIYAMPAVAATQSSQPINTHRDVDLGW
jgi:hypothetical protein